MEEKQTISQIFEKIVNDKDFVKRSENYIAEIMKDGKVDYHDIPEIVFLTVDTINILYEIEIDEDDLKILLKLVLIHLMKRYELVKDCDRYIIEKLLDTVIKLVLLTPIKKGLFCCFFK